MIKSLAQLALIAVVAADNSRIESAKLVLEPPMEKVTFALDVIGPNETFNCVAKEDFSMVCTTPSGESIEGQGFDHLDLG